MCSQVHTFFSHCIKNRNRKPIGYKVLKKDRFLRSSSKLPWSGASDKESHKLVNINSALANRKPCIDKKNIIIKLDAKSNRIF